MIENPKPKNGSMMKQPGKGHRDSTYSIRFSNEVMVREHSNTSEYFQAGYGNKDIIDEVYEANTLAAEDILSAGDLFSMKSGSRKQWDDGTSVSKSLAGSQALSDVTLQRTQLELPEIQTAEEKVAYWNSKTKRKKKKSGKKLRLGKRRELFYRSFKIIFEC